jgi:hypothetical protein
MVVLDATVMNIALPSAQTPLHFSDTARQVTGARTPPAAVTGPCG